MTRNDRGKLVRMDAETRQSLARPTSSVAEIATGIDRLEQQGFLVLSPKTLLQNPDRFSWAIHIIEPDPDRDWYWPAGGSGFAPHKGLLTRISSAIGIEWTDVDRIDDRRDPHYACVKVFARVPDAATGQLVRRVDSYELDLRDGSPRTESLRDMGNEKMLDNKRRHIHTQAVTGAKNRLIREAAGLRMDYTKQEITQPFAIVSVLRRGSVSADSAREATKELYGGDTPELADKPSERPAEAVEDESSVNGDGIVPATPDYIDKTNNWSDRQVDHWLREMIEQTEYPYAERLEAGGHDPSTDVGDLPESWKAQLYRAVFAEWSDTGDEIPF